MPPHQRRMASRGFPTFKEIIRDVPVVLRDSFTARFVTFGLLSVLVALIIAQLVNPGYTNYWWYQITQTTATLIIVLTFNAAFASEGGMAIETHLVVICATLADTIGTTFGFYKSWSPYDKIVHFAATAAFAAGVFQAFNYLSRRGILHWSHVQRGAASFAVAMFACGFIWEMYEYLGDAVFNSGRVQSRGDTYGDLASDTAGALVAVAVVLQYERRHHRNQAAQLPPVTLASLAEPTPPPMHSAFSHAEREYAMTRSQSSMDD